MLRTFGIIALPIALSACPLSYDFDGYARRDGKTGLGGTGGGGIVEDGGAEVGDAKGGVGGSGVGDAGAADTGVVQGCNPFNPQDNTLGFTPCAPGRGCESGLTPDCGGKCCTDPPSVIPGSFCATDCECPIGFGCFWPPDQFDSYCQPLCLTSAGCPQQPSPTTCDTSFKVSGNKCFSATKVGGCF